MVKKFLIPVLLAGAIATAVVDRVVSTSSAGAANSSTGESDAVATAAASGSQTAKATSAAKAFLKTLSSSQRSSVQYSFSSSAKKSGWSNLPVGAVTRNGLRVGDLSTVQLAALRKLLRASLSSTGYTQEEAIRVADSYLQSIGGGGEYDADNYYVALFGTPSTSKKWTLQFGGHHLAVHVTFAGSRISGTPYFVGVEPTGFTYASKSYEPLSAESSRMAALFASLDESELAAAKLNQSFDDVVVGPGEDGQFPTRQGLLVSKLSSSQKALLTNAIKAWVNDVNTTAAKKLLAAYEKGYPSTRIAWATSTDPSVQGAYFRIDGPRVWIEIASQGGVVVRDKVHYHSIWRDRSTDYGE